MGYIALGNVAGIAQRNVIRLELLIRLVSYWQQACTQVVLPSHVCILGSCTQRAT